MTEPTDRRRTSWIPALLLGGLCLFHVINNWIWLNKNAMTRGWDRIGSLINSLYYHETLSQPSLQAVFKATTQDQIRPPLFGLSMALMYGPFGVSPDVAVMVNAVYMIALVLATYGIGVKLGNRRLGLLAAFLVSFTPLVFAMSRYSYFEFSLSALIVVSIYFLLASERFEKRGASVLLGISLGLGLLNKRTFPVFVIGALGVAVLQAGLPRKVLGQLRWPPRFRWRDLALAVAGGGLLSALWYLPNRELAQSLSIGSWVFPIWWLLASITVFLLLQPSSPISNALSCGSLGISLASLWYLPNSDFVQRALRAGWGVNDPRGRTVDLLSLATYTDYVRSIVYGFSPIFSILLLLSLALLVLYVLRRRQRFLPVPWWNWGWWVIIVSPALAYVILSTSIYKEHRAITPLLPFLGILLAGVLSALPWRWLRRALISLAIVLSIVQFFAISYTEVHGLVEWTTFGEPILGQKGLFAQGAYLEVPDSGLNDPDYYFARDTLRLVEDTRRAEGWDTISLGVVANSSHVHVGMFAYDQLLHYPAIKLSDPLQAYPGESGYSMAFRYDYILVLSDGNRGASVREIVPLILDERREKFDAGFELVKVYSLPDGSEASLFRRRYHPTKAYDDGWLHDLGAYLLQGATESDLIAVHPPGLLNGLLETYWGPAPVVPVATLSTGHGEPGSESADPQRLFLVTDQSADLQSWPKEEPGLVGPIQEQHFGELVVVVYERAKP